MSEGSRGQPGLDSRSRSPRGPLPPCSWKPLCPGPRTEHLGAMGFLQWGDGEPEDAPLVLAKSAQPPGEAGGVASSELIRPRMPRPLVQDGRYVGTVQSGYVLACGRHPSLHTRVYTRVPTLSPLNKLPHMARVCAEAALGRHWGALALGTPPRVTPEFPELPRADHGHGLGEGGPWGQSSVGCKAGRLWPHTSGFCAHPPPG